MILIWGRRTTRKRLGRVGDFCPICREARPHRIWRVQSVPHFYWIPLGRGRVEGHEYQCEDCETLRAADLGWFVAISEDVSADLPSLVAETRPSLYEEFAERFVWEDDARNGRLDPAERLYALMEPFQYLEPEVAERCGQTHIDRKSAMGCLFFLMLLIAIVVAASYADRSTGNALGVVAAVVALTGLGWFGYTTISDPARYVRREVHPRLIHALTPLRPQYDELTEVAQRLRNMKTALGKKLNVDRLWKDLQVSLGFAPIEPV